MTRHGLRELLCLWTAVKPQKIFLRGYDYLLNNLRRHIYPFCLEALVRTASQKQPALLFFQRAIEPQKQKSISKVKKVNCSLCYCWLIIKKFWWQTTDFNLLYKWYIYSHLCKLNCDNRNYFKKKQYTLNSWGSIHTEILSCWGPLQENEGRWRRGNHCYYMWSVT